MENTEEEYVKEKMGSKEKEGGKKNECRLIYQKE